MDIDSAVTGKGGTFPTLICGEVVVKLCGHLPFWRRAHAAELAAMRRVAEDPRILAPRLLFQERLFDNPTTPWPYLVSTRMRGGAWGETALSQEEKSAIAAQLGQQERFINALSPVADIATPDTWSAPGLVEAAKQSVLPPHLIAQIDDFCRRSGSGAHGVPPPRPHVPTRLR
ncbi:MAG: hypothetical protein OXH52_00850 [Gammaproteobacteria bacterium]|nr:hypothetical protein [Gammaproteobacteria bacterium]